MTSQVTFLLGSLSPLLAFGLACDSDVRSPSRKTYAENREITFLPSPTSVERRIVDSAGFLIGKTSVEERLRISHEVATRGYSSSELIGSGQCEGCHPDITAQWAVSAHRFSSFNNPFYAASVTKLRAEQGGGAKSRWCGGCHDPVLLASGEIDAATLETDSAEAQAGLTCLVCHSAHELKTPIGNGNYTLVARGGGNQHKTQVFSPVLRDSRFCGTCHKVGVSAEINGVHWLRGQNEYDDWLDSPFGGHGSGQFVSRPRESRCQGCHMPLERSDKDLAAKNGFIRSHRFVGANSALPLLRGDTGTVERTESFLRKAGLRVDIFAVRRGTDLNEVTFAPDVLSPTVKPGETIGFDVVIKNDGVGHSFPGGTIDSNECWVYFDVRTPGGEIMAKSGFLLENGQLEPGAHKFGAALLTSEGGLARQRNVQDVVAVGWRNTISPGEGSIARYRITVPSDFEYDRIEVLAELKYRKFNWTFLDFVCREYPLAFPANCLRLPVTTLGSSNLPIRVRASSEPVAASVKRLEGHGHRFRDYGISAALEADASGSLDAFTWGVRLSPTVENRLNLARAFLVAGDAGLAIDLLDEIGATRPELRVDSRALSIRGESLFLQRKYPEAIEVFELLRSMQPPGRKVLRVLGDLYFFQGNIDRATETYRLLLELDPEDAVAHESLAHSLRISGDSDGGRRHEELFRKYGETMHSRWIRNEYCKLSRDIECERVHWHDL